MCTHASEIREKPENHGVFYWVDGCQMLHTYSVAFGKYCSSARYALIV